MCCWTLCSFALASFVFDTSPVMAGLHGVLLWVGSRGIFVTTLKMATEQERELLITFLHEKEAILYGEMLSRNCWLEETWLYSADDVIGGPNPTKFE